ncbi:MAG TPA: hypothetical protein DF383_04730, partial [Deltaproteobacteria bacterium]|nr:hypothetical protein [Deltaproteobacteria bacterium]
MMPRMDGYQLLEAVKHDSELKQIPFILLTAKVDLDSRIRGLEQGADEYISKPFNNLEIKTRVKNLLNRRKIEIAFIHAEKMISLGQLVAGVSHEILNPISYAKNANESIPDFLEMILKGGKLPPDKARNYLYEAVQDAAEGIRRVCEITEALKGFVRQGNEGFDFEDIHPGLDATLKIVHVNYKSRLRIHKSYHLPNRVHCNLNHLNQVFLNLIANAVQAMKGQNEPRLWIETRQEKENAVIEIRDKGPGIPEEIQGKIFNPFFTTKPAGQGTGLGLYISRQIVQEHAGEISVASTPGEGSRFTIRIPIQGTKGAAHDGRIFTHPDVDRSLTEIQYPYRR